MKRRRGINATKRHSWHDSARKGGKHTCTASLLPSCSHSRQERERERAEEGKASSRPLREARESLPQHNEAGAAQSECSIARELQALVHFDVQALVCCSTRLR